MKINYVFTGDEEMDERGRYIIPQDATHVSIDESVKVIPVSAFYQHPNIVELICHDGVEKIEHNAFYCCPRLKRVIISGVKIVKEDTFGGCEAVTHIECPNLEYIGGGAFSFCKSLVKINLSSVQRVEGCAFLDCTALMDVEFGKSLESIGGVAFAGCKSLEHITIPLKHGLITDVDIFQECGNLESVDLVEGEELHETIDALLLDEWSIDLRKEMDSINHMLPNAPPGQIDDEGNNDDLGDKARVMRCWVTSIIYELNHYKEKHRDLLSEAASTLKELALSHDIVMNNVLPFLQLPSTTNVSVQRKRKRPI